MSTHLENKAHEYMDETESMIDVARDALRAVMLGSDATGKHKPYSWSNTPVEKHLYKALGHMTHHLKQRMEFESEDNEYHLYNALNRVVMAIAIEHEKMNAHFTTKDRKPTYNVEKEPTNK
jgi:hypothetical protein